MMGLVPAGRYGLKSGMMENDGPGPGSLAGRYGLKSGMMKNDGPGPGRTLRPEIWNDGK